MPANAGDARDMGSIPGSGRSPGVGNGNPLQYSFLGNPMDRGACQATVHRVTESWIWRSVRARAHTHTHTHTHTQEEKQWISHSFVWASLLFPYPDPTNLVPYHLGDISNSQREGWLKTFFSTIVRTRTLVFDFVAYLMFLPFIFQVAWIFPKS